MRKYLYVIAALALLSSCGEYNKVLKSRDANYRFDYAKRAFNEKKYVNAATVLTDIITPARRTERRRGSVSPRHAAF